jgi:hypothetical protein
LQADIQLDGSLAPCVKQFRGFDSGNNPHPTASALRESSNSYNESLAKVFHQWVQLCTFTPTVAGDYYLQVRTNVSLPNDSYGEPNTNSRPRVIYSGNPILTNPTSPGDDLDSAGANAFAVRASLDMSLAKYVAVSGWQRMPIWVNATGAQSTFNLIQITSNAAGKYFTFSFFDVGDGLEDGETGTVKVLYPLGATLNGVPIADGTSPANCTYRGPGNRTGTLAGCSALISNREIASLGLPGNNGRLESIIVQVPGDYRCTYTELGDCWFRVRVTFPAGETVNDVTTWDASIQGDAVRLIK